MSQSFEPISKRLENAIRHNPHFNGRSLRVEANSEKIVLSGQVKSYFQKQMAQESVRSMAGVREIQNDLEVTWS